MGFLYITLKNLSWPDIRNELTTLNVRWIVAAIAIYWVELLLRISRWRLLLAHITPPLPASKIGIAFLSGYAANNVLPAKLGELFRADLLGRLADVSRLTAFGSIMLERMFDLAIVLGMTALGAFVLTTEHSATLAKVNQGLLFLVIPLVGLLASVYLLLTRKSLRLPGKLDFVSEKLSNLTAGLHILDERSSFVKLFSYSTVIWLCNCLAIWSIVLACNVNLSPTQTMLLVGMSGISAAIPAAPAGIGTMQYAFYLTALLIGMSTSLAVIAASLVQIALLGSATLVGACVYFYAINMHLLAGKQTA